MLCDLELTSLRIGIHTHTHTHTHTTTHTNTHAAFPLHRHGGDMSPSTWHARARQGSERGIGQVGT